ncbi:MAG TPA: HD domain-containing phosphohydrolase [Myxococcota bacterium]|jgi:response regulator RpfG family c-di-GMP phosphodiesterase
MAEKLPTVLVVDDERGSRESLRMILSPHHEVVQAGNGAEALEALRTHKIELMTLDLNMPGMKGEDVMRVVRSEFPQTEIIVITGCGTLESATSGIRYGICDYLQKPFDVVQVTASVSRALSRQRARTRLSAFLEELGEVVGKERDAVAILSDVERSQKLRGRLGGIFGARGPASQPGNGAPLDPPRTVEFLEVLAETIETKDRFMRGHARRVALYAGLIADRLCLSAEDHEHVRIAAFLHDLGKVGVPTDLLLRAGALDSNERHLVEQHPEIGARLIKPLDIPTAVSLAIRHHHEWWDGSGYPDGLAGEDIPLSARIISVADAFDAMSCDRPYRRALARQVVTDEFKHFGGRQFDPNLAKEILLLLDTGVWDVDPQLLAESVGDVGARMAAAG